LTGKHETQSIEKFSWGVSDRGASIRVPLSTSKEWKGYVEDRRPASNGDPYKICRVISESLKFAETLDNSIHNMNYEKPNSDLFKNTMEEFDEALKQEFTKED
jgi:glutamine synthetase